MSKPTIKFIYTGQFRSEVTQLQKGPANYGSSIIHPEYMPINYDQQPPVISTMEVNSKPTSPNSILRVRSAQNLRVREEPRNGNTRNAPNIQEETQTPKKQLDVKKPKPQVDGEIKLNAPSYKFVPRKQGDIAVHSRKEYKKNTSVEKCLNGESALRSKRHTNKNINNDDLELKSSNPFLKIESIEQRDFKTEPSEQHLSINNSVPSSNQDKIVLRAPKYKYTPRPEGELVVNARKKQYVKSENTAQKYFYGGVQSRQQTDFVTCFGCLKPTAKTYKAEQQ